MRNTLRSPRLTEVEREKMRLEETYRRGMKDGRDKPPSVFDKLDGPIKVLSGLAIAIGIFASLWQYKINSDRERQEAARTFQKAFYETQMSIYEETIGECSILATADSSSAAYAEARVKFMRLFWGKMTMFEDHCVEAKVIAFRRILFKYERRDFTLEKLATPCDAIDYEVVDTVSQLRLKLACLQLAHQCRIHTIKTWLPVTEQMDYNLRDSILRRY